MFMSLGECTINKLFMQMTIVKQGFSQRNDILQNSRDDGDSGRMYNRWIGHGFEYN
jgi:hypothetical protein